MSDAAPRAPRPDPAAPKPNGSGPGSPTPPARTPPAPKLERELRTFFAGIALAISATGDMHCAGIVASNGDALAHAYAELAKQNAAVKRILEGLLAGSAWGEAIMVTAATVIPIAGHHGLLPADLPMPFSFGLVPESPEVAEHDPAKPAAPTPPPAADERDGPAEPRREG